MWLPNVSETINIFAAILGHFNCQLPTFLTQASLVVFYFCSSKNILRPSDSQSCRPLERPAGKRESSMKICHQIELNQEKHVCERGWDFGDRYLTIKETFWRGCHQEGTQFHSRYSGVVLVLKAARASRSNLSSQLEQPGMNNTWVGSRLQEWGNVAGSWKGINAPYQEHGDTVEAWTL